MTYEAFAEAARLRAPVAYVRRDQSILHGWAVHVYSDGTGILEDAIGQAHQVALRYVFPDWRPTP
jgi:hypothetical protein